MSTFCLFPPPPSRPLLCITDTKEPRCWSREELCPISACWLLCKGSHRMFQHPWQQRGHGMSLESWVVSHSCCTSCCTHTNISFPCSSLHDHDILRIGAVNCQGAGIVPVTYAYGPNHIFLITASGSPAICTETRPAGQLAYNGVTGQMGLCRLTYIGVNRGLCRRDECMGLQVMPAGIQYGYMGLYAYMGLCRLA
jgi:hypothetical protein